jgi:hypothetical protein
MVMNQVDEMRRLSGSESIQPDPLLEDLAARSVNSLEMPIQKEAVRRLLEVSANELQKEGRVELSRLDAAVQLLRNPRNISIPDHVKEKQARIIGTAVRRVQNSPNQNAFLVLTLIGYTR